jgi:aminoglycoside 6'-N-acetyltransferase I
MLPRRLTRADLDLLISTPEGLFDNPVDGERAKDFLESRLHHLFMILQDGVGVSFASGTVLLHPDKDPSLFINEVGTRDSHQRQGLATQVTQALIDHARATGCDGIWLGTEPDNTAARALYRRLGGTEKTFTGYAWDGAFDPD